ncbi:suppressor of fused domain protein [Sediminibacterium goheungense]|uniref:Suppressor of fused protein SUFU n=1 Tax=Sediminibacterium goheungense TaxID=1086393 RepID=A0A4R6ITD6_9BACT|nr:suppressor of fused domain protein [Sediminibacterium goheungense]TDO25794.1 suppressor of fused protein SUFU [Sediminibacterium goheungense]
MTEQEYSESGNPIYRYDDKKDRELQPAIGDGENIEAISNHIENCVGKVETVFHEIVSDIVHIEVHWVKPTDKFPFHTLVTSGMSDLPMTIPDGYDINQYIELCILLPENWTIDGTDFQTMEEAFQDENNYWPVRWLKAIARFPHEYETFLGYGHTIPNGELAAPFSENTKLGCMLLLPSLSLGNNFFELKVNEEKTINFYCLYPLYKEEMDFKLKKGTDELINKFEKYNIRDVVDINRKNTCLKKGFLGMW